MWQGPQPFLSGTPKSPSASRLRTIDVGDMIDAIRTAMAVYSREDAHGLVVPDLVVFKT